MIVSDSCIVLSDVVFFFFQAEDGIRDVAVTGVQTCALPISLRFPRYATSTSCVVRGRNSSRNQARALRNTGSRRRSYSLSRSEEHTSELQSRLHLVCRLLLEKKKNRRSSHAWSRKSHWDV